MELRHVKLFYPAAPPDEGALRQLVRETGVDLQICERELNSGHPSLLVDLAGEERALDTLLDRIRLLGIQTQIVFR